MILSVVKRFSCYKGSVIRRFYTVPIYAYYVRYYGYIILCSLVYVYVFCKIWISIPIFECQKKPKEKKGYFSLSPPPCLLHKCIECWPGLSASVVHVVRITTMSWLFISYVNLHVPFFLYFLWPEYTVV